MSQKIQIRRGLDASRTTIIPDVGEPIWSVDTKKLWMGDGVTAGGIQSNDSLSTSSGSSLVTVTNDPITNGINLLSIYNAAAAKTPNGLPLASGNRYTILIPPGTYKFYQTGLYNISRYVDLVGLGDPSDTLLISDCGDGTPSLFPYVLVLSSGYTNISNLAMELINTGANGGSAIYTVAGDSPFNVNFNNVTLRNEGNSLFAGHSKTVLNIGAAILDWNINNSIFYGNFGISSVSYPSLKKVNINNCSFYGDKTFYSSAGQNCIITNSKFFGKSGFAPRVNKSWQDKNNVISNCYFSGSDFFPAGGLAFDRYAGKITNSVFYGNIETKFRGQMSNCLVDASNSSNYPINITNFSNNFFPQFFNCTIIAPSNVNATITGDGSGIMVQNRLNKIAYSGITGAMGNVLANSNYVDSRFN